MGGAGDSGDLTIDLLGPLELRVAGELVPIPHGARRVVLATLALRAGQVVPVSVLVDAVWGQEDGRSRAENLQAHIYQLRKRLHAAVPARAAAVLVTRPPGYLLDLAEQRVDVGRFHALAARGGKLTDADPAAAGRVLGEALRLWRGPALADVAELSDQLAAVAARLEEQRLAVLEDRVQADLDGGMGPGQLIVELAGYVREHPLRERLAGQHMLALFRAGRQGESLAAYQHVRRTLMEELGIEPGPELRALQARVLDGDPALLHARGPAYSLARPAVSRAPAPVRAPRQLPAAIRHFTGRRAELKRLGELLEEDRPGGTVLITALGGSGGVGKTSLALHWAHQVADRFPDGQIYINLRGYDPAAEPLGAPEAIRALLDCLGIQAAPLGLDGQTAIYRTLVAEKRMIIVLDNARDASQVRPLLPASPSSVVIVTSRDSLDGLAASDQAIQIPLDALCDEDAEALLRARMGAERLAREPGAVGQLLSQCAGLPLALSIVAARATARPRTSLGALAAAMADNPSLLDALETGDPAVSVRAAISWSYQQLPAPAARMFRLLGIHPGPDISVAAAASLAAASLAQARRCLAELTKASLLTESMPGRYAFHDLIRAFATEQASCEETAEQISATVRRCLDHYLHSGHAAQRHFLRWPPALALAEPEPGVTVEEQPTLADAVQWFATEIAVNYRCIALAADTRLYNHAWQITWTCRTYLFKSGWITRKQVQALAEIITVAARASQGDDVDLGAAHYMCSRAITGVALGGTDDQAGVPGTADSRLLEQAAWHGKQALRYFTAAGDLAAQGWCQLQLGQILFHQRDVAGALLAAEEATSLMTVAGSDYGQAIALTYQGSWVHALGQYEAGRSALERSAAMLASLNRTGLATAYRNIGEALWREQRYGAAEESLRDGLAIYRRVGNVSGAVQTLAILGNVQAEAGDAETARATWREALGLLGGGYHVAAADLRGKLERYAGPAA